MIEYRFDSGSGLPTYLQLIRQTKQAMILGRLQSGDRLPAAHEVVASTGVNPNTVLKGYRELAREGLANPHPGSGTYVTTNLGRPETTQHSEIGAALGRTVQSAHRSGISRVELEAMVIAWLDEEYDAAAVPAEPVHWRLPPPPADPMALGGNHC